VKQCRYCGIDIEDTAVACRWCGTDLKPKVEMVNDLKPTVEVVSNEKPPLRATDVGWWVLAIVLSVLLLASCVWMLGRIH
jgi:uncharacterized membrane protein YvbJ